MMGLAALFICGAIVAAAAASLWMEIENPRLREYSRWQIREIGRINMADGKPLSDTLHLMMTLARPSVCQKSLRHS